MQSVKKPLVGLFALAAIAFSVVAITPTTNQVDLATKTSGLILSECEAGDPECDNGARISNKVAGLILSECDPDEPGCDNGARINNKVAGLILSECEPDEPGCDNGARINSRTVAIETTEEAGEAPYWLDKAKTA